MQNSGLLVLQSFSHAFLFVALALFPIVNPLGMAPIFLTFTAGVDDATRARLARLVAYNSFLLATVSLLVGSYVLKFFGLSLPAVQIGGGLVVAVTGWRLLSRGADPEERRRPAPSAETVMASAFYPLTMPLTVGPGSIAVMLTIGSNAPSAVDPAPLGPGTGRRRPRRRRRRRVLDLSELSLCRPDPAPPRRKRHQCDAAALGLHPALPRRPDHP